MTDNHKDRCSTTDTSSQAPYVDRYPSVEARDIIASVPGGVGYHNRLCIAVEIALNNEWHRGARAERDQCANIALAARSEAAIERHRTDDPEGKACWLWAFDTAVGIEREIRARADYSPTTERRPVSSVNPSNTDAGEANKTPASLPGEG